MQGAKHHHSVSAHQDFTSVTTPITMNATPASTPSIFGLIQWDNKVPASTPSAEVSTSASDAAMNTTHALTSLSEANNMVASWVLSPSSATNTVANTVSMSFQSKMSS